MRSPSGGEARRGDVTQVGKAPPLPEVTISDLTRGQVFGEDDDANQSASPALPDVRPAPQAGCFVSGLQVLLSRNCLRQLCIRHRSISAVKRVGGTTRTRRQKSRLGEGI